MLNPRRLAAALLASVALLAGPAEASNLGVSGQVFEIIEEDFRLAMMRLVAQHDWEPQLDELKSSATNYTKNLPQYMRPRATKTQTTWKDVGVVATEDIYLPWVDPETGSVFEPGQTLAIRAGTYLNPIEGMLSAGIPRLFIFDGRDPEQLLLARMLIAQNLDNLHFMLIAGDVGELSTEVGRPIYHPSPQFLDIFNVSAVPALVGFGRGAHQGHLATTVFAMPAGLEIVQHAWFGLEATSLPEPESP